MLHFSRLAFLSVLTFLLVSTSVLAKVRLADEAVVTIEDGAIRGSLSTGARSFKGIPFIAAPVGNNRFREPQPVTPWTGQTYNATSFKPGCPQRCILPPRT